MTKNREMHNWYSERAKLLQEIAIEQPIATDSIRINFKKLDGDKSVMYIQIYYENGKQKRIQIPMSDDVLAFSMFEQWLTYINTAWCCGSASVTVDNEDEKTTLSFEPVIHRDKHKFKHMINDIFETAYFYVYSSKKKRIVLSAYIDSFFFFDHLDCMMKKFIKENEIFKPTENEEEIIYSKDD